MFYLWRPISSFISPKRVSVSFYHAIEGVKELQILNILNPEVYIIYTNEKKTNILYETKITFLNEKSLHLKSDRKILQTKQLSSKTS